MIERFLMDLASRAEVVLVEDHLQACSDCCSRLLRTEKSLRALREILKEDGAELLATHETSDGGIWLILGLASAGVWNARIVGPDCDANATLNSREETEQYLQRTFDEMYTDHLCTDECRSRPLFRVKSSGE